MGPWQPISTETTHTLWQLSAGIWCSPTFSQGCSPNSCKINVSSEVSCSWGLQNIMQLVVLESLKWKYCLAKQSYKTAYAWKFEPGLTVEAQDNYHKTVAAMKSLSYSICEKHGNIDPLKLQHCTYSKSVLPHSVLTIVSDEGCSSSTLSDPPSHFLYHHQSLRAHLTPLTILTIVWGRE